MAEGPRPDNPEAALRDAGAKLRKLRKEESGAGEERNPYTTYVFNLAIDDLMALLYAELEYDAIPEADIKRLLVGAANVGAIKETIRRRRNGDLNLYQLTPKEFNNGDSVDNLELIAEEGITYGKFVDHIRTFYDCLVANKAAVDGIPVGGDNYLSLQEQGIEQLYHGILGEEYWYKDDKSSNEMETLWIEPVPYE
ncbi:hypothetical protein A3H78_01390 [Candidatus Roizmanbacteria bacterium RIFCSPLOWO2_02_FULL_36_11]|uniref:Uncharacterized protein n=1 Tax=Candidatus Roizmanbacteria bacterium RIFCSPLOWO2_02_FULL_36_11 TaxID=1802071 RepID=A0A1F7JFB2_9BACT|nr:MAG: hypothetical protein A3H78_01390 [Candidatus Roizmanbacteria bacterium RIFCSPLOWO2_02_FULL_36_11]